MKGNRKRASKQIRKLNIRPFAMKASEQVKDQIIYVRLRLDDVERLDLLRKEFQISSRSEMIRSLLVGSMDKVTKI